MVMPLILFFIFQGFALGISLCQEVQKASVYSTQLQELSGADILKTGNVRRSRGKYMEIEYRRTWNQSVMLITGHVEEENYELKMLKHNTVAGLLPVEEIQETGDFRFCYDITGKSR